MNTQSDKIVTMNIGNQSIEPMLRTDNERIRLRSGVDSERAQRPVGLI